MSRTLSIDSWDPDYGGPVESSAMAPSDIKINADVEISGNEWKPIQPLPVAPPNSIAIVDGVRRIDAYAWLSIDGQSPVRSVLASIAAGGLRIADSKAVLDVVSSERCFSCPVETEDLPTRAGQYKFHLSTGQEPEQLTAAIQQRLGTLEVNVARELANTSGLVIVDGPLRGRQELENAIGYVKTHQVSYLPGELQPIIGHLSAGQRSPVFFFTTSWSRYSWYVRLPGPANYDWWGIVRLEAAETLQLKRVRELADLTAQILPRFASSPHKDPRAPQNLYPIAGLERELRRRLGDPAYISNCLKVAAAQPMAAKGEM